MKILKSKKSYVILAVAIIVSYFVYTKFFVTPAIQYNTAKVQLGTLKQTVTETGSIQRADEVNLNFLTQGRIATITVEVGARVKKDQILAELDHSNLDIQIRQAEANLEVAKANEQKLLHGASSQDVNIGQTSVVQAQVALDNAKKDFSKTRDADNATVAQAQKNYNDLQSGSALTPTEAAVNSANVSLAKNKISYQKTIDNRLATLLVAIHDKKAVAQTALDAVNRILTDDNAKDTLGIQDSATLQITKNSYAETIALSPAVDAAYQQALSSQNIDDAKAAYSATDDILTRAVVLLNNTFTVLSKTVTSAKLTQAQLDAFKANISSQVSQANAGLSALEQAKQALDDAVTNYDSVIANSTQAVNAAEAGLNSAQLVAINALTNAKLAQTRDIQAAQARIDTASESLKLTQAQLGKTLASARIEDVALVSAQVKQAQANLDAVKNQLNNSLIKAPFDGQVTQSNYQVGEEPTLTQPVIILLGEDQFDIKVDIAESDVAKVAVGNQVELDFDAFGEGIKFGATLDKIDPAQTVIQEVVYYQATVGHMTATGTSASYLKQIKPGMTANLTIMANKKDNVLIVPFRAVIDNAGIRTVRVLRNNIVTEVPVKLGLRGDDGLVEIISGLTVNDEIILSVKTATN